MIESSRCIVGSMSHRVRPQRGQHLLELNLLLQGPLGTNALAALERKEADEHGLGGGHSQNDENHTLVPFPRTRRPIENLCARRQAFLGQSPALKLSPVDY